VVPAKLDSWGPDLRLILPDLQFLFPDPRIQKGSGADLWRFRHVSTADRERIREKVDGSVGLFLFFVSGNSELFSEELHFLNTPKVPLDAP